ncbi:MAG: NUDIX hydrolase, partial [Actinobacteria bacterium]|nr:NUDIX hydrolase [Actinomycetota bacterium]
MSGGRSGDGFMRCSDGHVRWGVFGAAGVVFVLRPADMPALVMLQKRSAWAHEGGTWSCAGGAIDE